MNNIERKVDNIELIQDILQSIIVEVGMIGEYSDRRERRLNELYDKTKLIEVQDE
jgi:hypothetical protein